MANYERIQERLAKAKEKTRQLQAQLQQGEALERARLKKLKREQDAKRKQVLGSILLKLWQTGTVSTDSLMKWIGPHIQSNEDRMLFLADGCSTSSVHNQATPDGP